MKLWFHLLWLKRAVLLLCLCVFPDPHPACSPGTGPCVARADLSYISLAERLCLAFSGFSFLSLPFPLADPPPRLLFNHTSLWWPGRRECQAGRSGVQEVGTGRSSPFSPTPVSCCWPCLGEDALSPCSQMWSSGPPFHPFHALLLVLWGHTSSVGRPLPLLLFLEVQGRHEAPLGQVLTWSSHLEFSLLWEKA